jgi:hypothetical protein
MSLTQQAAQLALNVAVRLKIMLLVEWFHLRLDVLTVLPPKARLVAKFVKELS